MNEPAQRCEEQIISLFQDRETQVCQGWILKKMGGRLLVYPLYSKYSQGNIPDNIQKCEEISRRSGLDCVFRIVEHTNYHLSSILTDNGYVLKECGVVGEWNVTEDAGNLCVGGKLQDSLFLKNEAGGENAEYVMADVDTVIGIKKQELLFLPDGNLPDVSIENILRFSVDNGVTRILADIPGREELPEQYGRAGFQRGYLYRCYQKEEKSSKEQED
ncbi:MAG: hypothetical protein HDQ97_18680 [Lachnospiraceae bacterium]|nr:hypothetical protein [Lachnospiraceae bacterium]